MATTTPNFGWDIPQSTDLVKDGATAIAALGTDIDTSLVDLKGGTTGQILSKNSNTDMDFTWITNDVGDITAVNAGTGISGGGSSGAVTITNDMATTITASGDIVVGTGNGTYDNLPIGTTGQVLTADTTVSPYKVKWANASAGINWTQRKTPHGNSIRTIAYNGSNLYVAAGASGELFSSSDALTWTSRTSGFGAVAINKVAFGNGLWVAVGANGTVTTSTDGTTWTARTSNMGSNEIYDVIYANSEWIMVGAGGGSSNTGGIAYSSDGITWTRKSQTPTIGTTYYAITWNGTNFIVGATLSTNNFLYGSSGAGTWTAGNEPNINQAIEWLAYDGTRTIGLSNARYFNSTSTTLAATNLIPQEISNEGTAASQRQSMAYYNGKVYSAAIYFMIFETNPVSLDYPTTRDPLILSPGAIRQTSTPFLGNGTTSVFVGSAGIIVATSVGRIFTSF